MHPSRRSIVLIGVLAACAAMLWQAPVTRAGADTIVVNTTDDELNADGDCSLREAVVAVNTQAPVDDCPAALESRNIFLEPGEYRLTIPGAGEDAGLTGDLDVLRPISIDPVGSGAVTIDGGGLDRIFDVHPSADSLRTAFTGLVLRNGDAGAGDGGAIRISDVPCDGSPGSLRNVDLFGVVVDGSRATRGGGVHIGDCNGVLVIGTSVVRNTAAAVGGGISIEGLGYLDIETSTISRNHAGSAGGGLWADPSDVTFGVSLALVTVAQNSAPTGGGVWATGNVSLITTPILASNDGGNCGGPGGPYSWAVSDDDTCGGPAFDDVRLMPLSTVNGFPVHLLAPGSPAIEAAGEPIGENWCSGNARYDQVGTDRPLDGDGDGVAACDAGAIEAPAVPLASPPDGSPPPLPDTAAPPIEHPRAPFGWVGVGLAALAVAASIGRRDRLAVPVPTGRPMHRARRHGRPSSGVD